jgi:tetratricopeptide (TPR) repeat protein
VTEHDIPAGALDRFAAGRARPGEGRRILTHLLAGCSICRERLHPAGFPTGQPAPAGAYDAALAAAEQTALGAIPQVRPAALRELEDVAPERRELKLRNQPRYASVPLVEALVERSHELRYQDSERMLREARLAVALAEALKTRTQAESEIVSDARARAWGQLGNAHRVRSEIPEARSAFKKAFRYLERGSGDLALRALLCRRLAALRVLTRNLKEAMRLLTQAVAISQRLGDRPSTAEALMTLGIVMIFSGNPDAALQPLRVSFRMFNRPQDEALKKGALLNVIRCWIDLGQPVRAYTICVDAEPLMANCKEKSLSLFWEWHRGLIDRDLGLLDAAETRLRRAREGFIELDLSEDVAVLSLDLATVYLRADKVPQSLQAVADAIPIFRALGIQRDLLAALVQLGKMAYRTDRALAVVQKVIAEVRDGIGPVRSRGRAETTR